MHQHFHQRWNLDLRIFPPENDFGTVTLYNLAGHIQMKVFPALVLVIAAISFLLSLLALAFIRLRRGSDPKYRKQVKKTYKYLVWISVATNIAVAAGTQQAAQALEWGGENGMGRLELKAGNALVGLQWTIVGFSTLFAMSSVFIYNATSGEKDSDVEWANSKGGPGIRAGDNVVEFGRNYDY